MRDRSEEIPPQPGSEVQEREGARPTEGLPTVPVELFRLWRGMGAGLELTTRLQEEAVVFETSIQVGRALRPPELRSEMLNAATMGLVTEEDEAKTAGFIPGHLGLSYRPQVIEEVRLRALREGHDIPNSVFAPDTRSVFQDTSFPWSTAGRVETSMGSCTGTMIGRRLMVTGSHCIEWTGTGAGWIKFTPAYYNGTAPFGVAWGQTVISWLQADGSDGLSDQETAFDYVVVVLDRNIGDLTGYVGYRTYSSSWNNGNYWDQIGYPADLTGGQRPVLTREGVITSVGSHSTSGQDGYVLGNFIDTFGGHSGGPYWGWWADETFPRLVGTDSTSPGTPGTGTIGDNEAGGGPALSSLISYARQNYP